MGCLIPVWLLSVKVRIGQQTTHMCVKFVRSVPPTTNQARSWSPSEALAREVAVSLKNTAASIRIVTLPGLPPKGDVSDWLNAGGTEKELERLAAETPEWSPPDEPEPAPRKPHRQASATRPRPRPQHGAPARYCQQALESEIEDLRATHEGRNNRLTRAAFVLGQLVAPGQLDRQDVEGCLLEACRGNGSLAEHGEAKCRDTIRRGLDDGLTQPRVIPRTSHHPQDAVAPEPVGRQTPDTESPAWTSSDQRPVGQSPQAGAPQDLRTPTLQVLDLAGLLAVYRRWLYLPDEDPLYAALATVAANRALDGDPVWLLVVGTPGSGKTESIQPLVSLPDVHPAGTLTEASLLSGTPRKDHGAGSKGGLLRAIGERGILLCKDFGSIFSLNRDAAAGIMAALREIFDGAWTRHVGTDGGKTLEWKGRLGLIGGCTPTLDRQHSVMASLGERFLFVRFRDAGTRDHARSALRHAGKETAMRRELDAAVTGFFASLPPMKGVEPITSEETETLLDLCALVARCRSSVERNAYGREIELIPGAESPTRLTVTCLRLFSGLVAIGTPREGAWRVVRRVALDSMPALRFRVIRELFKMEKAGWRTPEGAVPNTQESEGAGTGAISRALGYPTSTGRRTLEDLDAYGIVKRSRIGSGKEDKWRLDKSIYTLLDTFPEKSEWVCTEGVTGGVGMAGELFKHPIPMTDDISGTVDFRHTGQQVTAEKRIPGNSSSIPEREPGDDPEDFTPTGMPDDPIDF